MACIGRMTGDTSSLARQLPAGPAKDRRPASSRPGGKSRNADELRQAALTSASSAARRRPLALLANTSVMR
jgi:hypothetical protein